LGEYLICTIPEKTVVLTRGQQQYVRETYRRDTVVIPNGYGISYDPGAQELAPWGLTENNYILSVCRLIPHKGIHYLIDAFKQLEDAGRVPHGVKLVIVGSGFHTDAYEQQLRDMGSGRANIIFTGTQSGAALAQLYSHACVFVQPSESEGLSISLLEAMGCGTAPLVSSIAENMEPLQGLGFIFASRNVEDLKNKLSEVLRNRAGAEAMGKKVRALAERAYNWDSIAERYLRLYEELLGH
ncbi:MAG: glycosyltransferase family 4 protein, partial [Proteobacteria bacterium]|nr:glycosyltransferase family 4 protein [Pseudomonadota bacterium]